MAGKRVSQLPAATSLATSDLVLIDQGGSSSKKAPVSMLAATITGITTGVPNHIINVRDEAFGAVGDGVSNDAAAILAAIEACRLVSVAGTPPGRWSGRPPGASPTRST